MKIKNIEQLRNHVLHSLEQLAAHKIDVTEASIVAKASETIMSSVKLQLSYAGMLGCQPDIAFLEDCHTVKTKLINPPKKAKS
jgi:DNA-binding XRE family transcriptional regulator